MVEMKWYFVWSILLGYIAWRSGHVITSCFLPADLPSEYFAYAHASAHCDSVRSSARSSPWAQRLAYCEDETFWDIMNNSGNIVDRHLVISCDPSRREWEARERHDQIQVPAGALWLVESNVRGVKEPRRIHFDGYPEGREFHPLGVKVWPSIRGDDLERPSSMFVVNRGSYSSSIEQFVINPKKPTRARYVRSFTSNYFVAPNSLALTSNSSFFYTNDHLLTQRLPSIIGKVLPLVETFLALPLGAIAHVEVLDEDKHGSVVFHHTFPYLGIPFPNGISLSPDGRTLAVASSSLAQVYLFNRIPPSNTTTHEKLDLMHIIRTPFSPDNIAYVEDNRLLVAGHTNFPALLKVAANETNAYAPSWVVEITPRLEGSDLALDKKAPFPTASRARPPKTHDVTTVYQGNGSSFSGSTTGLYDRRSETLFVTGLFEEGILVCRVP